MYGRAGVADGSSFETSYVPEGQRHWELGTHVVTDSGTRYDLGAAADAAAAADDGDADAGATDGAKVLEGSENEEEEDEEDEEDEEEDEEDDEDKEE